MCFEPVDVSLGFMTHRYVSVFIYTVEPALCAFAITTPLIQTFIVKINIVTTHVAL